jgi:hypothetical protein
MQRDIKQDCLFLFKICNRYFDQLPRPKEYACYNSVHSLALESLLWLIKIEIFGLLGRA